MLAGCEHGGTGSAGVGTWPALPAASASGARCSATARPACCVGAAAGGIAGNMTLDRPAEQRRQQEAEASQDAAMRRQLDFERQRALQADEVQREIEERRLFDQWQRERNAQPASA